MKNFYFVKINLPLIFLLCCLSAGTGQTGLPLTQSAEPYDSALTEQFTVAGLEFQPQTDTRISWDPSTNRWFVYGDLTTELEGQSISFTAGTSDDPGMIILIDESVNQFSGTINDEFSVKGMRMTLLDDEDAHFSYDAVVGQFMITGRVNAHFAGESVESSLSDTDNPGILIEQGNVDHVHIHIGNDFTIAGLANSDPDILLKWTDNENFQGHGKMWITFQDGLALANLGSNSDPGMLLTGGTLDSLNMEVAGGALLFEVLPTIGLIKIKYSKSEGTFNLTGKVATELPFVREGKKFGPYIVIDAGLGSSEGIVYDTDNNKLTVENASFDIKGLDKGNEKESVEVGGFQLKELKFFIQNNLPSGIEGIVEVPPGAEVDAELLFTINTGHDEFPFQINEIKVSYVAETMEALIPMGETGFSLVIIEGSITGMEDPATAVYQGCLGFIFGDLIPLNFVVMKTNGAIAYFEADVQISASELIAGAQVHLGSFQGPEFLSGEDPCPSWTPLLGEGDLTLDFQWGVSYSLDGHLKMFAEDPFITAELEAFLSANGNFDAKAEVDLVIPHFIPIVGGKTIVGIEGVVRYLPEHQNMSYAAGWTRINFLFDHVFVGAKMNLGTGQISKIGSREAKQLVADVEGDPTGAHHNGIPTSTVFHTFEVSDSPAPLYLQGDLQMTDLSHFNEDEGHISIYMIGPSTSDLLQIYLSDDALSGDVEFKAQGTEMIIREGFYERFPIYMIEPAATNSDAVSSINGQPAAFLTPGTYTLKIFFYYTDGNEMSEDDFDLQISPVYPRPVLNNFLFHTETNDVLYYQIQYNAYLQDSTIIAVYTNNTPEYKGGELRASYTYNQGRGVFGDPTSRLVDGTLDFGLSPDSLQYGYCIIDDHANPPVYSDIRTLVARAKIEGKLTPMTGSFNPADTFRIIAYEDGVVSSSVIAGENGEFSFYAHKENTSYRLDISTSNSDYYITPFVSLSNTSPPTISMLAQNWLRVEFFTDSGAGANNLPLNIELSEIPPLIFGSVHEPGSNTNIPNVGVHIFNADDSTEVGYTLTNETGFAVFKIEGVSNYYLNFSLLYGTYHWDPNYFHQENVTFGAAARLETEVIEFNPDNPAPNPVEFNLLAREGFYGPIMWVYNTDDEGNQIVFDNVTITLTGDMGTKLTTVSNVHGFALFEAADMVDGETYTITASVPDGYSSNIIPGPFQWPFPNFIQRYDITPQL